MTTFPVIYIIFLIVICRFPFLSSVLHIRSCMVYILFALHRELEGIIKLLLTDVCQKNTIDIEVVEEVVEENTYQENIIQPIETENESDEMDLTVLCAIRNTALPILWESTGIESIREKKTVKIFVTILSVLNVEKSTAAKTLYGFTWRNTTKSDLITLSIYVVHGPNISKLSLMKTFQILIPMPFKKCGKCGKDNFNGKDTIFDCSKRKGKFSSAFNFDFLCENHFQGDQVTVYSNGIKKWVYTLKYFRRYLSLIH